MRHCSQAYILPIQIGGPFWHVPFGRKDGLVSVAKEAEMVPMGHENVTSLIEFFQSRGLGLLDLVILSGTVHSLHKLEVMLTNISSSFSMFVYHVMFSTHKRNSNSIPTVHSLHKLEIMLIKISSSFSMFVYHVTLSTRKYNLNSIPSCLCGGKVPHNRATCGLRKAIETYLIYHHYERLKLQ